MQKQKQEYMVGKFREEVRQKLLEKSYKISPEKLPCVSQCESHQWSRQKIIIQNLQDWIELKPDGNKLGNKWEVSSVKPNLDYFSKSLYRKGKWLVTAKRCKKLRKFIVYIIHLAIYRRGWRYLGWSQEEHPSALRRAARDESPWEKMGFHVNMPLWLLLFRLLQSNSRT